MPQDTKRHTECAASLLLKSPLCKQHTEQEEIIRQSFRRIKAFTVLNDKSLKNVAKIYRSF
jgi:hypothetical protein